MRFTIGMATHDDYSGHYFTIQALRLYHDMTDVEIIVVDNFGCDFTEDFVKQWVKNGRYVRYDQVVGTSAPRDLVFREATGDVVMCVDSHVMLAPGAVQRWKRYFTENPGCRDLVQGPMLFDSLDGMHSHFAPIWDDHMWGKWAFDRRAADPAGEPFEIPMQGLGLFSCRKDAWLGFNSKFRGFGGEEGYIHEKFRQAGYRALCAPWLRWVHRFGRPYQVSYPLNVEDRIHNYLVGHAELKLDLKPIFDHFRKYKSTESLIDIAIEALGPGDYDRYLGV